MTILARPLLASLALLVAANGVATASPPLPSDVALTMTVEPAAAPLLPGNVGVLSLRVENRYPSAYGFALYTGHTPVSIGSPPIRLFALPDASEAACDLQQIDDRPSIPGRYWFMTGGLGIGAAVTCRIGFEILPPGQAAGRLEFRAAAFGGQSPGYIDLTPEDNVAELPFGQPAPALAVPAARPAGFAASVLVLLLVGLLALRRRTVT